MSTAAQADLTEAPERLAVPTCLGCGAIRRPGTCTAACREQRIEIVPAGAYDELVAAHLRIRACVNAFRAVAKEFVSRRPADAQYESAYRSVRDQARVALHRFPERRAENAVLEDVAEPTTAWWCPECGGVDGPRECLEFCIWRVVEWVSADTYRREREGALADRDAESRVRQLLRRVASVTPREDQWEACWHQFQAERSGS